MTDLEMVNEEKDREENETTLTPEEKKKNDELD